MRAFGGFVLSLFLLSSACSGDGPALVDTSALYDGGVESNQLMSCMSDYFGCLTISSQVTGLNTCDSAPECSKLDGKPCSSFQDGFSDYDGGFASCEWQESLDCVNGTWTHFSFHECYAEIPPIEDDITSVPDDTNGMPAPPPN